MKKRTKGHTETAISGDTRATGVEAFARKAAYRQAVARLQQGTSAAATTLLKTLIDPDAPPSVKVRAAEAIFNHAAKAIEIEDIDARVSELERAAEESDPGQRRS
jgi:hypothetical protein